MKEDVRLLDFCSLFASLNADLSGCCGCRNTAQINSPTQAKITLNRQ